MAEKTDDPSLFESEDYKAYLKARIAQLPKRGRGFRSQIAQALRCQTAYVSQVLNGAADFNLEQALIVNRLLGHTEDESRYFILLVERARAGSRDLQEFFTRQIAEQRHKRTLIRERFKVNRAIQPEDQALYYSQWFLASIHVLTSIPQFQTPAAISAAIQLPVGQVLRSLEFLTRCGLVKHEGGKYRIGEARIHLSSESPLISKHHMNWRLQAMRSLERETDEDVHYTSVVSVAPEDVRKIRALLVDCMDEFNQKVAASPEVEGHCLALDFFRFTQG